MTDYASRQPQFPVDKLIADGFRSRIARDYGNLALIRGVPVLLSLPFRGQRKDRQHVPGSFFGINVAPGSISEQDEFTLAKVQDLGIKHLRLDYPQGANTPHRRLLTRLAKEGFPVLLHVVQYPRAAAEMGRESQQQQWRDFLQDLINQQPGPSQVELGSAANRYRFSGYTLRSLLLAIDRAAPILEDRGIPWSAPGLSDFEPIFLAAILSLLRRHGLRPGAVSCNLHVDRAGGPEIHDPHVAGEALGRILRYDLTRKLETLSRIARAYSVKRIYCSFFSWTLLQKGVNHRRYVSEEQQANYVSRYLLLAAASGSFDRVFLGPLVSHSRGLVDGFPLERSFPPAVVLSPTLQGSCDSYRDRPAYFAARWLAKILPGTQILGRLPAPPKTCALAFQGKDDRLWVAIWTQDGAQTELNTRSVKGSAGHVSACDRSGRTLSGIPELIGESPIFLSLESIQRRLDTHNWFPVSRPGISVGRSISSDQLEIPISRGRGYVRMDQSPWAGVLASSLGSLASVSEQILGFSQQPVRETRHARIFRSHLKGETETVQIKEFQPSQWDSSNRSRASRAWSNLLTAQRLNLSVPTPLGSLPNI